MAEGLAYSLQSLDDLLRQRMMDQLAAEKVKEQIRQFNVGASERSRAHDLQLRQQDLVDRQRGDVLAETERQHDIARAGNIVNQAVPGDQADQPTQDLLKRFGYGGAIRTVTQDPYEGVDPAMMGGPDVTKTGFLRGGASYLTAEANRINQAKIASDRAIADAQRTQDQIASRELIASEGNKNRAAIAAGQLGVQQGMLGLRQAAVEDKKAEAAKEAARKAANAADQAQTIIGLTNELEQHPGFTGNFGIQGRIPNFPGGASSNAKARLDQLLGQLSIEKLAEMKAQSKTGASGFGALSDKELNVLQAAAGRLQQSQSPEEARVALREIRERMQKVIAAAGSGAGAQATGGGQKKSAADWLKENGL